MEVGFLWDYVGVLHFRGPYQDITKLNIVSEDLQQGPMVREPTC